MSVADRIKSLMWEQRVTGRELSRRTKIPQPTVSNYVNGKFAKIPFASVVRIARALDVSVEEFVKCVPSK